MIVDVFDDDVLRSLKPIDLATFLRVDGWARASHVDGQMSVFRKQFQSEEAEVVVPLRTDFRDYAQVIHELVATLSKYQNESQLSLIGRIQNINSDLVKIRVAHASFEDGTIPLDAGAQLIDRARDLILSAAWAARSPRAVLANRRPVEIDHFLRSVRLGQTERGSYIVTIKTVVPPSSIDANGQLALGPEMDEPFERQVTKALSRALGTVKAAIGEYGATGTVRSFEEAVQYGVSANLLESVEGILENTNAVSANIAIAWSATREVNEPLVNSVSFTPEDLPVLRMASEYIRMTSPKPEYKLEGFVQVLRRDSVNAPRYVSVRAVVDGKARKVLVQLSPEEYELALKAQGDWKAVQAFGELVKVNRSYELRNATDFRVYESDDSEPEQLHQAVEQHEPKRLDVIEQIDEFLDEILELPPHSDIDSSDENS